MCYLGMVLHAQKRSPEAMKLIERALVIDPRNPLVKFNKAMILFALNQNHESLQELVELKELAPRESSVFFLMGKIYKKVRRRRRRRKMEEQASVLPSSLLCRPLFLLSVLLLSSSSFFFPTTSCLLCLCAYLCVRTPVRLSTRGLFFFFL